MPNDSWQEVNGTAPTAAGMLLAGIALVCTGGIIGQYNQAVGIVMMLAGLAMVGEAILLFRRNAADLQRDAQLVLAHARVRPPQGQQK